MASFHECIDCGAMVTTEATIVGPFEAPPSINHVHEDGEAHPMEVVGYDDHRGDLARGDA